MEEFEVKPVVPRDVLVKEGTSAVACLAGGVFLLLLAFAARFPVVGIILSAIALVVGIGALTSRSREDKKPGLLIAGAGLMGLLVRFGIPVVKPFAAFLLGFGGVGLFAAGIIKGIKFLWGLKSRS